MAHRIRRALFTLHGFFAVSFFICIAYVCAFRARDTLDLIQNVASRKRFEWAYILLGALMFLTPVIAYILKLIFDRQGQPSTFVFWIEAAGVYVFAIYLIVKSREVALTHFDEKAASGEVAVTPLGLNGAFRAMSVVQRKHAEP